jgi:hypothetical protein
MAGFEVTTEAVSRLGEGAQALDALIDKFRAWQEYTNSIFWAAERCASKWKSGSIQNRNHGREANTRADAKRVLAPALLHERLRRAFALLTQTYHGSRLTGQLGIGTHMDD